MVADMRRVLYYPTDLWEHVRVMSYKLLLQSIVRAGTVAAPAAISSTSSAWDRVVGKRKLHSIDTCLACKSLIVAKSGGLSL